MTHDDALYHDRQLVAAYDVLNQTRGDFAFYRTMLPGPPARVLDLGCGTGTFAIELAQLGYNVTALDPSHAMIALAKEKRDAGRVDWFVGTADAIQMSWRFDVVIMAGHAFQCLLEDADIESLFQIVSSALAPSGLFLFESRNPARRGWENWRPENAAPPVRLGGDQTVQVFHDVLSVDSGSVTFRETYRFEPEGLEKTSMSRLRFADRAQIETLASSNGLATEELFGDWNGSAFNPHTSPEMIFRMKRRTPEKSDTC